MFDENEDGYRKVLDYTKEDADHAIDMVGDTNKLHVVDLNGDASMENIEKACYELEAMGVQNIFIDNLTGIQLNEKEYGGKVGALDECVKRIGQIKDRMPVTIFLVTHLKRPDKGRTPHEEGGDVWLTDMRGSGAIGFWASYVICPQRNTRAETLDERTTTFLACVKDRDQGIYSGSKVMLKGDINTGRLREPSQHQAYQRRRDAEPSNIPVELPPTIEQTNCPDEDLPFEPDVSEY